MKYVLISVVAVLSIAILLNRKINIWKIIRRQFAVYRNDKTKSISVYDIFTFVVFPIIMAIALVFLIDYEFMSNRLDTMITILSIAATVLFSFLTLLMDKTKAEEGEKAKQVSNETYVTIIMTILYALLSVIVLVVYFFMPKMVVVYQIFNAVIYLLLIKILLNILMVLKRMFLLLN